MNDKENAQDPQEDLEVEKTREEIKKIGYQIDELKRQAKTFWIPLVVCLITGLSTVGALVIDYFRYASDDKQSKVIATLKDELDVIKKRQLTEQLIAISC